MDNNMLQSQIHLNQNQQQFGHVRQNTKQQHHQYQQGDLHQQQFDENPHQMEKFDIQGRQQQQQNRQQQMDQQKQNQIHEIHQNEQHLEQHDDNQIDRANIDPNNQIIEDGNSTELNERKYQESELQGIQPIRNQPIYISQQIRVDEITQKNKNLQENILTACKQRRDINKNLFSLFVKKRTDYIEKHFNCYQQITNRISAKIKETNEFIPYFIKYFNQISQLYKDFCDGNKKVSAFKYLYESGNEKKQQKLNWSENITKGVKLLIELKENTISKLKNFQTYISTTTSKNLQKHINEYNKNVQKLIKELSTKKQFFHECENNVNKKIKRIHKIFLDQSDSDKNEKNRKDLLQQQLEYFTQMNKANNALTSWGNTILQWWKEVISAQIKYTSQIKTTILDFFQNFKQIHSLSEKHKQYFEYWRDLNVRSDVDIKYSLESVLTLIGYDLIRSSLSVSDIKKKKQEQNLKSSILQNKNQMEEERIKLTFQDFSKFNTLFMLKQTIKEVYPIIDNLIIKRFICQRLEKQKLVRVAIASTINQHLIFYDDKQLVYVNKMQLKRLLNARKSEYIVNANQKIEGFIIDTWNKQVLHFKNPDQAEQFMFYTENNQYLKEKYVLS